MHNNFVLPGAQFTIHITTPAYIARFDFPDFELRILFASSSLLTSALSAIRALESIGGRLTKTNYSRRNQFFISSAPSPINSDRFD